MKPVMIMGCTSDAGKSFLVAALCRYFANRGLRVAPFKAQNMSNNAAVTPDGLEMGRAQYAQASAARAMPDVRMNPILLKPSADTYSQVIVLGKFDRAISEMPWMARKPHTWQAVREALHSLIADYDLVIIEGAGSPAEVNLREADIVNMAVALECHADVYLVADIDRGGSFAHLLGTWMCLSPEEQALIKGFVLNKFRGDPALLGNAMDWLQDKTGVPTVAIVPWLHHALPEEDRIFLRSPLAPSSQNASVRLALIGYPYASNFDEFDALVHEREVEVTLVQQAMSLDRFDAVLLPGSKNSVASLMWLRQTGLADEIARVAQMGKVVHGICGGLQILGQRISDPNHLESGDANGLGLLDVDTELAEDKITQQRQVRLRETQQRVHGYEIHHGRSHAGPSAQPLFDDAELGWRTHAISGVYLHGLFDETAYRENFLRPLGWHGQTQDWRTRLDNEFNAVAEAVAHTGWTAFIEQQWRSE